MGGRHQQLVCVYYEVLRPANKNDLRAVSPEIAAALGKLPSGGYVSSDDLGERALAWACANGIMRRTRLNGRVLEFESVRFWVSQLNAPKARRVAAAKGTRQSYSAALDAFNEWLHGREYPVRENIVVDGRMEGRNARRSFSDVEDLLRFCEGSDHGAITAGRVLKQYLAHSADSGCSLATALVRCSAVKSYFTAHDISVSAKVNRNRHRPVDIRGEARMSLVDIYKMVTSGKTDVMAKAIVMIKFQAGLDASTLADRFNFEAYQQIVRYFGIEDYEAWDLDKCPVPIRLVRVKTGMKYTTFIDRDAVVHLQDYMRWKELRYRKKHDIDRPLFVTQAGTPVSPGWISDAFSKAAVNAGIQRRISRGAYRVRAHETRDLLKSTLLVSGCATYVADHVLGHYPRDSYEKQAILYPEALRREYAKASHLLNMFTGFERYLETAAGGGQQADLIPGRSAAADPERYAYREMEERQRQTQETLQKMAGAISEMMRIMLTMDGGGDPGTSKRIRRMIKDLGGDDGDNAGGQARDRHQ